MGRRAHHPELTSRRQVEAMAAYGVPETDIARVLAIDPKTLRKHYRDELDTGQIKANSKVAESLYRKALGDGSQSVTAAIFWLKTRAGWKEPAVHEGTEGGVTVIIKRFARPTPDPEEAAYSGSADSGRAFPMIEHHGDH
jgi:hypothetical protein